MILSAKNYSQRSFFGKVMTTNPGGPFYSFIINNLDTEGNNSDDDCSLKFNYYVRPEAEASLPIWLPVQLMLKQC